MDILVHTISNIFKLPYLDTSDKTKHIPESVFGVFVTIYRFVSQLDNGKEQSDNVHGCIGYWDHKYRKMTPQDIYAYIMDVAEKAMYSDPRRNNFPSIFNDPYATVEISFMQTPVYKVNHSNGKLIGTEDFFDNKYYGLIIQAGHKRATFLPGVFNSISWDEIKETIKNKAGIKEQNYKQIHRNNNLTKKNNMTNNNTWRNKNKNNNNNQINNDIVFYAYKTKTIKTKIIGLLYDFNKRSNNKRSNIKLYPKLLINNYVDILLEYFTQLFLNGGFIPFYIDRLDKILPYDINNFKRGNYESFLPIIAYLQAGGKKTHLLFDYYFSQIENGSSIPIIDLAALLDIYRLLILPDIYLNIKQQRQQPKALREYELSDSYRSDILQNFSFTLPDEYVFPKQLFNRLRQSIRYDSNSESQQSTLEKMIALLSLLKYYKKIGNIKGIEELESIFSNRFNKFQDSFTVINPYILNILNHQCKILAELFSIRTNFKDQFYRTTNQTFFDDVEIDAKRYLFSYETIFNTYISLSDDTLNIPVEIDILALIFEGLMNLLYILFNREKYKDNYKLFILIFQTFLAIMGKYDPKIKLFTLSETVDSRYTFMRDNNAKCRFDFNAQIILGLLAMNKK